MKKLLVFLIIFTVWLSSTMKTTYGLEQEKVPQEVQSLLQELKFNPGEAREAVKLLDSSDKEKYLLIEFEDIYVVFDLDNEEIIEISESKRYNIDFLRENKSYYGGPFTILSKSKIKEDLNNRNHLLISNADLKEIKKELKTFESQVNEKRRLNIEKSEFITSNYRYVYTLPYSLANYSHNRKYDCGATATAMAFRYLDNHFNNNYVPSQFSTEIKLVNELIRIIGTPNRGILAGELYHFINSYLKIYHPAGRNTTYIESASPYKVMGQITSFRKPVVLNTLLHPNYGQHFVTAYGISYSSDTSYAIVNDGHGVRGAYISFYYIGSMIVF